MTNMTEEEALRVTVLEWLSDSGHLQRLEEQCQEHRGEEKSNAVYKFVIRLDPCDLLQYSAALGNLVLHNPRLAWRLFQQVCYTAVTTLEWLPSLHTPSQLLLLLRLSSLPDLPGYVLDHASDFPSVADESRFFSITGVVCGMSLREKYSQSACFYCPREGCVGGVEGSRYIRLHVAGATESTTIRNDFTCYHCGTALMEDVAYRTLANKVVVSVIPARALQMAQTALRPSHRQRYQALTIILRDDLCEGVRMGEECTVIGIPVYELSEVSSHAHINTVVEANNVIWSERSTSGLQNKTLPSSVWEIHEACQYSPWAFAATLAYSFAAEVAPPGTYHQLKLAMLLSLVTCTQSRRGKEDIHKRLHLLASGSDPAMLLQLLTYGGSLAPRSVQHSSVTTDLAGCGRKEGASVFVDAGSLVLAEGGVCLTGNINRYKKDVREKLQHALETGEVTLNLSGRLAAGEAKQLSWPLQSNVWACSDRQQRSRAFTKADADIVSAHTMHETSTISKAFADCLGLVVVTDSPSGEMDDHVTELLTQHLLESATGLATSPPLSENDFRKLLEFVWEKEVALSPRGRQLLQAFYLASRRVRVSSLYATAMPISALDVMSALAIAHARLSLRKEATEEDAVLAILLYEESLASRFGYSVLSLVPTPHFRDDNIGAYIGREFDRQMRRLHVQIVEFCKYHAHSSIAMLSEE